MNTIFSVVLQFENCRNHIRQLDAVSTTRENIDPHFEKSCLLEGMPEGPTN